MLSYLVDLEYASECPPCSNFKFSIFGMYLQACSSHRYFAVYFQRLLQVFNLCKYESKVCVAELQPTPEAGDRVALLLVLGCEI